METPILMVTPFLPSGKRLQKTMEKSTMLLMGKSTISMVIFNSYVTNYQSVISAKTHES